MLEGETGGKSLKLAHYVGWHTSAFKSLVSVGITAAWTSHGSYESVDPSAETRASAVRQQCYWNKDIENSNAHLCGQATQAIQSILCCAYITI
jgi:hypothetical protein